MSGNSSAGAYPPAGAPYRFFEVCVDGRDWRLRGVLDQAALLEASGRFKSVPYGLLLWPSAVALAELLASEADLLAGARVLELGCGLGLPGLTALAAGASVTLSDHEPAAIELALENAALNGLPRPNVLVADWADWPTGASYDLVVAADVLYERAAGPALLDVVGRTVALGGAFIAADPERPQALEWFARAERAGWEAEIVGFRSASVPDEPTPRRISLLKLERRSTSCDAAG
ncbi:MAG: methyltransferase domain-containing protein [Armatimonadetes bacterium]|nr:methyltransferase domain-containing protein [Armatimonadota bacterium]MDE2206013.1 methyltransferase domain-containing protein [Armatimonadota bacterium]